MTPYRRALARFLSNVSNCTVTFPNIPELSHLSIPHVFSALYCSSSSCVKLTGRLYDVPSSGHLQIGRTWSTAWAGPQWKWWGK